MSTLFFDLDAGIATVSELTGATKSTLSGGTEDVVVRGEVSGPSRPRSGHVYPNLKDDGACLARRALAEHGGPGRVRPARRPGRPRLGERGRLRPPGQVSAHHRPRRARGDRAFSTWPSARCSPARGRGLFDPERKRPLPEFPGSPSSPARRAARRSATSSRSSAVAGPRQDPGRPVQGPGPGGRGGGRRGDRIGQPCRRGRPRRRHPGRREPRRPGPSMRRSSRGPSWRRGSAGWSRPSGTRST